MKRFESGRPVYSRDLQGASNLPLLKLHLKNKLMVRHSKKNHLKDLGPKSRRIIFLDAPQSILEFEKKNLSHLKIKDLLNGQSQLGDIVRYRQEVGRSKIKLALEYITDLLESNRCALVVAAYHVEVVDALHQGLKRFKCLKIQGGMTAKEKDEAIREFQNPKSENRVMVGNTLAMGLGVTLTRASRGVFVEPEWTPGVNEQMEDRLHRITQTKHVIWDYLVLRGSLDERILLQVLSKQQNIHAVMN